MCISETVHQPQKYDYTTKFIIEHKSRVSVVPSKDGPVKSYFTTSKGYWRLIITWIPMGKYFRFHYEIVIDTLKIFSRTLVLPWTDLKQSSKKKRLLFWKEAEKRNRIQYRDNYMFIWIKTKTKLVRCKLTQRLCYIYHFLTHVL